MPQSKWFWHTLALALGRTVKELQTVMTVQEFRDWQQYYALYPFDDLHRYHRPAALVAASMGGKYKEKIDFLAPPPMPEADINTMRAFGFSRKP